MRWTVVALLALAPGCNCGPSNYYAASTFDNDDDGWTLSPDATTIRPELSGAGGDPGGHICGTDGNMGNTWYFVAPDKFLHDASKAFSKRLTWSLRQDNTFQQLKGRDVVLQGNGLQMIFNIKATPGTDWKEYAVRLDGSSGWKKDEAPDFPDAGDDEMKTLLRNVTTLKIRGEYKDGPDHGCLDNVYFGVE